MKSFFPLAAALLAGEGLRLAAGPAEVQAAEARSRRGASSGGVKREADALLQGVHSPEAEVPPPAGGNASSAASSAWGGAAAGGRWRASTRSAGGAFDEAQVLRESHAANLTTFTDATDAATFTRGRTDTLRRGAGRGASGGDWLSEESFQRFGGGEGLTRGESRYFSSEGEASDGLDATGSEAFESGDVSSDSLENPAAAAPPLQRRRRKNRFSVKVFSAVALAPLVILLGLMIVEKMNELRPPKRVLSSEELENQLRRDKELSKAIARLPARVSLSDIQKELEKAEAPPTVAQDIANALSAMQAKDRAWETTQRGSAFMQVLESFFDHVNETQVARRFKVRNLLPVGDRRGSAAATGGAARSAQEVDLEWRSVLKVSPVGVFLEVAAANKASQQVLGERPLSLLLMIGQVREAECADENACLQASERTFATLQADREQRLRCFRSDIFRSPKEALKKFGVALPTHTGRVGPPGVPFVVVEGEAVRRVVSSDVLLGPLCFGSLEEVLKTRHRLSMESRTFIASLLLREVAALNLQGLCHNGLGLDAVVLDTRGVPVFFDLRSARRIGEERRPQPPWLLSPEEAEAFQRKTHILISPKLDSWALGVALYQLFSNESPFEDLSNGAPLEEVTDSSTAKSAAAIVRDLCPSLRLRELDVPELWRDVVAMLMQPNPEDRPTAAQVLSYFHSL